MDHDSDLPDKPESFDSSSLDNDHDKKPKNTRNGKPMEKAGKAKKVCFHQLKSGRLKRANC